MAWHLASAWNHGQQPFDSLCAQHEAGYATQTGSIAPGHVAPAVLAVHFLIDVGGNSLDYVI